MKKKDIIIVVIASIIIIAAVFLLIRIVNPSTGTTKVNETESDTIKTVPTEFDEKTFERIQSLSDYGNPTLENVGKADIFSSY